MKEKEGEEGARELYTYE